MDCKMLRAIDMRVDSCYTEHRQTNEKASPFAAATKIAEAAGTLRRHALKECEAHPPARCGGLLVCGEYVQQPEGKVPCTI